MMKRLYLGLLAVAAIAALTTAGSLALFTSSPGAESQTFTAGTVTLTNGVSRLANVSGLAPGDGSSQNYTVNYSGNLSAWLGLDTSVSGDLASCDGSKFTVTITDSNGNTYANNAANQIVMGAAAAKTPVANGASKTFTVAYSLPLNAGNDCQGDTATVSLTVRAVQSTNNTNGTNDGPISWLESGL